MQERSSILHSLAEAVRRITAESDLERLLEHLTEAARQLTGARYAALGVFDETGEQLIRFLTSGMDETTRRAIGVPPAGRGILGYLAKEEGAVRLMDLRRHPASIGFPAHHPPMRSFLGVSIRAHGRLFGRLYLTEKQGAEEFTEVDEDIILVLAGQAGEAIGNNAFQSQIKRAEANYHLLLESAGEGIWGLDLDGNCTFINRTGAKIFGYQPEDMIGRNMQALVHHSKLDGSPCPAEEGPISRACRTGQSCQVDEETLWRRDGTMFQARYSSHPIIEDGVLKGAVVVFTDITERRQLEEQLRQTQKMEAIGRLAGGIAHDFNNMLTVITGCAGLLLEDLDPADRRRRSAEEIKKAADRAAALTRQILAFSRKQLLQPIVLDLNPIVAGLGGMLRRLIGSNITLVTVLPDDSCHIKADPVQLEQMLLNLGLNARDAMPEGGALTIETKKIDLDAEAARRLAFKSPGLFVRLTLRDTGTGMDSHTMAHIFEPFFTTKEVGKGTGLGMATVHGIVTQSGGAITIASAPGEGTTMTVYFPFLEAAPAPVSSTPLLPGMPYGSETVLLVEDEPSVRQFVMDALRRHGYLVLEAATAMEALQLCVQHQGRIHLLLTDMVMPGMSGRELFERITATLPAMKVLCMSGHTEDAVLRQCASLARTGFLPKPFTPEDLAYKVREVLDAGPPD
jgi:PAS domain S-box-containing protein